MTDIPKDALLQLVYTDFADDLFVAKLECRAKDSLEWLEGLTPESEDFMEHIMAVRACITLLQWYTVDTYEDLAVAVNKHSLKLEEYY